MKFLAMLLAITAAPIGGLRDDAGAVSLVHGLPGNFIVAASSPDSVLSYAHSGSHWIAKLDSEWRSGVGGGPAPAGAALFGFDRSGRPALAYFESTACVRRLETGEDVQLAGAIESIAVGDASSIRAIANRNGARMEIRIGSDGGQSEFALDGVTGPAFLDAYGDMVFLTSDAAIIHHPNGVEVKLELPAPAESIEQFGEGLLYLRPGLVLRYRAGLERLYRLPRRAR